MKKVLLVILIALIWLLGHATEFMTGAYGSYDLWNSGAQANIGTLKSKLVDGGFNTVQMSYKDQNLNALGSVLSTLGDSVTVPQKTAPVLNGYFLTLTRPQDKLTLVRSLSRVNLS